MALQEVCLSVDEAEAIRLKDIERLDQEKCAESMRCLLDHILSERDAKNLKMKEILDHETEPWGVAISKVELKEIDLPESMQRAMAKQAEAERERRATIINADGELQAAEKLSEAASLIAKEPVTLQLRYLQTIREIGVSDQNSTLIPVPVDLFKQFFKNQA